MGRNDLKNFFYLNRDNQWIDFQRNGLDQREDGSLQLAEAETKGVLYSNAIRFDDRKLKWHRIQASAKVNDGHIQFFLYTSDEESNPPQVRLDQENPFSDPKWRRMPIDIMDLLIGIDAFYCLWIGACFWGEGKKPILYQIRVEYDHETYLNQLPIIYSRNQKTDLIARFLSLFESSFDEIEKKIDNLSTLFDPSAISSEFLPWLAQWLALDIDEDWDESKKRQVITKAFEIYGWRGTPKGLRRALKLFAGIDARIEEPILNASWWSLSDIQIENQNFPSILGFNTMLLPASAQGAVVGTTATLDQSHLITDEEFGAPLFEAYAHQFSVQIYLNESISNEKLNKIRELIDREKPAHTIYHLCVIKPRMRVGFQSRIGIDTIVGGETSNLILDEPLMLGFDTAIAETSKTKKGERNGINR